MRFIVFALLMVVCLMLVVAYACLVAASEAEERADRIYREYQGYKKKHS